MKAALIGVFVGIGAIIFIALLRGFERRTMYGLALTGIGFLYVGFTWSDPLSLGINILQALFFVFLSYFGIRKAPSFLIVGYFLHGLWDLVYTYIGLPPLRPPHYDLFCLAIDFTIGIYLIIFQWRITNRKRAFL